LSEWTIALFWGLQNTRLERHFFVGKWPSQPCEKSRLRCKTDIYGLECYLRLKLSQNLPLPEK